jgi:hypothetical protein
MIHPWLDRNRMYYIGTSGCKGWCDLRHVEGFYESSTDFESFWCEICFADRLCKISNNGNGVRATKCVNKGRACAAQFYVLKRSIRSREERVAGVSIDWMPVVESGSSQQNYHSPLSRLDAVLCKMSRRSSQRDGICPASTMYKCSGLRLCSSTLHPLPDPCPFC